MILSFALYPDGNKKRNRNSQGYLLGVDQFSKNGSDGTDNWTIKKHLKNLKVLFLGVLAVESEVITQSEVAFVKFQIKKKKQYKVKKEFQSPNENIPLPLLLFYKKKKNKPIKASKALADILNVFLFKINNLHKEKNLKLKNLKVSKEDIIKINSDYETEIKAIAENIFNTIEVSRPDILITGIFIDPYFIRKVDGKLFLEDTIPSDTMSKRRNPLSCGPSLLGNSDSQQSMEPEAENYDSNAISNDISISDISRSLELSPFEFIEELPNNLSVIESESVIDLVDDVQLEAEINMPNHLLALATIPQVEEKIIISIPANQHSIPMQDKSDDWNAEMKSKINCLLLGYQKNLKKHCFFYDANITNRKQSIINDLLNKLNNSSSKSFVGRLQKNSTADILNRHRSFLVQICCHFFNYNQKTRGKLLLDNILANLSENTSTINSRSV